MRKWIAVAAGVLLLALVNWNIYGRERLLSEGQVVLLELTPIDPRSLMQGDYMALRFAVANSVAGRRLPGRRNRADIDFDQAAENGLAVVALDARGVGSFRRIDDATPLAADERRLRYRLRRGEVRIATNAFFFQEGDARWYERARFGELRVAANGDALLTGLRGDKLERLGPDATPPQSSSTVPRP